MFALVENGSITQYPVDELTIRQQNPHISFPVPFVPVDPYVVIFPTDKPVVSDSHQIVSEDTPSLIDDQWAQTWKITTLTKDQYSQILAQSKTNALQTLANIRWEFQQKGIFYNGNIFATDDKSRNEYYLNSNNTFSINWKMPNGTFIVLTPEDIQQINTSVKSYIQNAFSTECRVADLINSCNTIEDVEAVAISDYFN